MKNNLYYGETNKDLISTSISYKINTKNRLTILILILKGLIDERSK